jgi:hypothetical protein
LIKNSRDQNNLSFYGKSLLTKLGHYISVDCGEMENSGSNSKLCNNIPRSYNKPLQKNQSTFIGIIKLSRSEQKPYTNIVFMSK